MQFGKPLKKARYCGETLSTFAFRNEDDRKALFQPAADSLEDPGLRYNKKRAGQAGPFEMCFEILKSAASDNDVISRMRQLDRNRLQRSLPLSLDALPVD